MFELDDLASEQLADVAGVPVILLHTLHAIIQGGTACVLDGLVSGRTFLLFCRHR